MRDDKQILVQFLNDVCNIQKYKNKYSIIKGIKHSVTGLKTIKGL